MQRIAWDATHDVLTGLLNRRGFDAILHAQVEAHRGARGAPRAPLALLMIDLDGFKAINDCYGHAAGDDVLRGIAERVVQNTRTQDHVAWLGGDEFAVILPNCDLQTAVTFADRIRAALARQPVLAAGARAQVALSQGWWNCWPAMPMQPPSWHARIPPATARRAKAATPSPRAERNGYRRAPMKKPPDSSTRWLEEYALNGEVQRT